MNGFEPVFCFNSIQGVFAKRKVRYLIKKNFGDLV